MAADQPLDTTIGVVTPENIAFEYQLAGPFRRLPAYLFDFVIRWGSITIIGLLLMLAGGAMGLLNRFFGPLTIAFILILVFLVSWFYGTVFEAYFNGRTPGKWLCGIRVIQMDGRPVSPRGALLRNLLRIADMAPVAALPTGAMEGPLPFIIPTGIIGLICMMMTQRMQRLGDLAGGTMVVVDERKWQLPVAKVDDARVPALASYIPGDYLVSRKMARTLSTYVERRHFLTPPRRREVARNLTEPLTKRFEFRHDIDPDLLLYALYYKTFLADSATEPASLGALAGYSPLARDAHKPVGLPGTSANGQVSSAGSSNSPNGQPDQQITAAQVLLDSNPMSNPLEGTLEERSETAQKEAGQKLATQQEIHQQETSPSQGTSAP